MPGSNIRARLPELAVEAAFIVFAVLFALAVDQWWEGRELKADAARLSSALQSEVKANLEELRTVLPQQRQLLVQFDSLGKRMANGPTTNIELNARFSSAELSAAMWDIIKATQTAGAYEVAWLSTMAKLYDLQRLYESRQEAFLDQFAEQLQVGGDSPPRFDQLRNRLFLLVTIGASLESAYAAALRN